MLKSCVRAGTVGEDHLTEGDRQSCYGYAKGHETSHGSFFLQPLPAPQPPPHLLISPICSRFFGSVFITFLPALRWGLRLLVYPTDGVCCWVDSLHLKFPDGFCPAFLKLYGSHSSAFLLYLRASVTNLTSLISQQFPSWAHPCCLLWHCPYPWQQSAASWQEQRSRSKLW